MKIAIPPALLALNPDRAMLDRVTDGGHPCYESIDAMCRANGLDPEKVT